MPTIKGTYFPSPSHEREKYKRWAVQLRRQVKFLESMGERTYHHIKAAERMERWAAGQSAQDIKGI